MKRFSIVFLPIIAVAAALFGICYLWIGVRTVMAHNMGPGLLVVAFGIAGIALGAALWSAWRQFMARMRNTAD